MKHTKAIILFLGIAILSVSLRLYHITYPIADWHSWRQADTAAVARNYTKRGIDFLHPRYDDLSNIQTGKDNPQGYRMVEFPLYQGVGAFLYGIYNGISIEIWLRILTILASTGTALLVGILFFQSGQPLAGILAMFVFSVLPYSMYYGRSILPDPLMVFLSLATLVCLELYKTATGKKRSIGLFLLSGILAALSILVKPYAVFLLIPSIYILCKGRGSWIKKILLLIVFGIIALVPFILWRTWIMQFPQGIPASEWLLNGNGIRFKGSWFQWLFAERIGKLILGYWGLIPLGLGMVMTPPAKEGWTIRLLGLGSLLYMIVVASGNVQHDYYQILLLPVIALFTGKGLALLVNPKAYGFGMLRPWVGRGMAMVVIVFSCMFSWYTIRTFYWINRPEIVEVGKIADRILPYNAKVIASYNGDTTFLYQTNRQGWPLGFDIPDKLKMGATHYVTVSPTDNDLETRDLARDYTVLVRTDKYAIIDLTKKK